ncbi:hypothetical protein [Mycolicibacterium elephantis]|uniref:Uncharacterized protein n=1 Tax=Mycolicibacterium elephantis DSM 44368 TaxID=1335622 RepID=A0A439DPT7_9MYCO|nr:hypothetical protein [Mycolicibacterium elephantis]MCV7219852.1 hypothetical protein [Mycolicibacterium elephantis]OBA88776.1 hypothetical protein A5633_08380 [Mycolicibacterium elephantis]RWA17590.1 hypothetical protein MELE44368_05440 [Mycolicibacterium elephantis DSM 44368]
MSLYMYHCWQVQDLLGCLEFDDLLPEEVAQLVTILGTAYGRKIACTPLPPGPGASTTTDTLRSPLQLLRS